MSRSRNNQAMLLAASACLAWTLAPAPAASIDGSAAAEPTYYEELTGSGGVAGLESQAGGLPSALHVVEAHGGVEYRMLSQEAEGTTWEVSLEVEERNHERVDAVYDLVLALPMPASSDGMAAYATEQWRIEAREGSRGASVALIYSGEKLTLKRNVALERAWLPSLQGSPDGLPDLTGTGNVYTLWDAVIRYDPTTGTDSRAWPPRVPNRSRGRGAGPRRRKERRIPDHVGPDARSVGAAVHDPAGCSPSERGVRGATEQERA